ncbi:MAG TPA: DUF6049 family protein [Acidimicrobiales bacterium]|nr:DUF6049 family protein [Acidimicrobiales bacterium]
MRAARTASALVAGLAAFVAVLSPVSAQRAGSDNGSMTLSWQSPWVGADADFMMRLRIQRPKGPSNLEVAATVYPAVATRSEFAETLRDRTTKAPLLPVQVFPLGELEADGAGDVPVALHLQDRLSLGPADGVFPVRVELRERGSGRTLHRFTTHIVHLPNQHTGARLGLALVLPVHAAPSLQADGGRRAPAVDQAAAVNAALDAARGTPVALAPTPETLALLAAVPDERTTAALRTLQERAATTEVLSQTFVPTNLPGLVAVGLERDAVTQVTLGAAATSDVLRVRPEGRPWLSEGPLDERTLAMLGSRGVDRLVLVDGNLEPIAGQNRTVTQPFQLRDGSRPVPAVSADPGLAAHFDNALAPALAASHLLADLAVIYLDQPSADRRGVAAVAPRSWRADRSFVEMLIAGLNQHPVLDAISLDALFSSVAPLRGPDGRPLARRLARPGSDGLTEAGSQLRTARRRVDALGSVLGTTSPAHAQLEQRLLLAESRELRTPRQRQPYIDAVLAGIDAQRREIRMPENRSITLTDRKGEIPVTFQNRTGVPARVVVKVQSDKLDFPRGTSHTLDLTRRNTTERFTVVSRTSGAFPLRITLESPDGNLVIGQTRLTVRSTAASSVSLIVSLGAALFLAVWWGRHALRGRRARKLVPQ